MLADLNEVAYGHGCRGRCYPLVRVEAPVQFGIRLAESHQPSCKSLIGKWNR